MDRHPIQKGKLFLITLGHFWVDSYANILPALLPLVIFQMDLSLTLAGILASVFSLASSLTQTVMGYLADKMRVRYFVVLGLLFSAVFVCSIGLAPDYLSLLIVLTLGGLGIAAFHPQTVTMAGEISGRRRGLGVALFVAGGTAGYALSPYWITVMVSEFTIDVLPYAALPGLATVVLLLWLVPLAKAPHEQASSFTIKQAFVGRVRPLMLLTLTVVARSVTRLGMMAFLPVMLTSSGMSLVAGGVALSTLTFSGAIGSLIGGTLSDRVGRRVIITLSMIGSGPLLYGAIQAEGSAFYVLLALGGFMLFMADAVVVATAQELVPERPAIASSMVMGLGWGLGGLAVTAVGGMSDAIGVPETLSWVALIPVAGAVCCFGLPSVDGSESTGSGDGPKTVDETEHKNVAAS